MNDELSPSRAHTAEVVGTIAEKPRTIKSSKGAVPQLKEPVAEMQRPKGKLMQSFQTLSLTIV